MTGGSRKTYHPDPSFQAKFVKDLGLDLERIVLLSL